jgi:hypothetical protein
MLKEISDTQVSKVTKREYCLLQRALAAAEYDTPRKRNFPEERIGEILGSEEEGLLPPGWITT